MLVAGDEIAIFDGVLMVGAFTLDQVSTPENQFDNDLTAFSVLNTQPGYQSGNNHIKYTSKNIIKVPVRKPA